ncbi:hypothetical protein [Lactococcus fujiensis]|uniref:Uncharacterized protein n=1 Tax=Lactococcus fujiensis JCM 16395 TaxID=1291764 RepID=A0A2A5RIC6_9LACT|nr:hypothetical protein [Lactococcus fujiensis]PCR98888.1 hypothetical protein RT41_GL000627 [Lactococcus fujiensis JCM 16395]
MKSLLLSEKEITVGEVIDLSSPSTLIVDLDEPLYSYRDGRYNDRAHYSPDHDLDEVAGIYQDDQDAELLSQYDNLNELVTDYVNTGTYDKWEQSFTLVSYNSLIDDFIERDLLPTNGKELVEKQLKIGNITTNESFFDLLESIFVFYTASHHIATEGFYAELVA